MSYRVDHDESIPSVVSRLKEEHREIDRRLEQISEFTEKKSGDLKVAVSMLNTISPVILRHAVEEEARLAQVIMNASETRKRSDGSVRILQEHRRIKEFYDELPYLLDEHSKEESRKTISEFVDLVTNHHKEEEKEAFPLALSASPMVHNTIKN